MTMIIRTDLSISGTVQFKEDVQLAPGVKITVLPGAVLDLGGYSLQNYGTISLEGSASSFAVLKNGTYTTESTSGVLISRYGNLNSLIVDSFFSYGALTLNNSLLQKSNVSGLASNSIVNSIFVDSSLNLGSKPAIIDGVTFFNSPVEIDAWFVLPDNVTIVKSNFVGVSLVINLNPFFNGSGMIHGVVVSESYVRVPIGSSFEAMVYDATDDLRVVKDLMASDFVSFPVINSATGFTVGTYNITLNALLSGVMESSPPVSSNETNALSVVVEKGVLATDAVYISGLIETKAIKDGLVTSHKVIYNGSEFDYSQIDALIMTVVRNGNFTEEFRQEMIALAPAAENLSYQDLVTLVGVANIDKIVLHIAGADGYFVA